MAVEVWEPLRDLVQQMLGMVQRDKYVLRERAGEMTVKIAGETILLAYPDRHAPMKLEQLAMALEGCIAFDRAGAMLRAAGAEADPIPLWLITGSSVLATWLQWSGNETMFRKRLALIDKYGMAPVFGSVERRARRELGHANVKIRVRCGLAVAEHIELPGKVPCAGQFGNQATVRIEGVQLPETMMTAIAAAADSRRPRRGFEVLDHPFFSDHELTITGVRIQDSATVIEIDHQWGPLQPVPQSALDALPVDFDAVHPFRPIASELKQLYAFVDAGRKLLDQERHCR